MYPTEPQGARVRLHELDPSMTSALWPLVRDEGGLFGPPGFAETEHELRHWLDAQRMHAQGGDRTRYRWAVQRLDTGALIGSTRIYIENVFERQGSIGYGIAGAHRRHGFASEAAALALAFAVDVLELHRIWATIEPDNETSMRLVERLGFRREGFLEKRVRVADDDWRDAYLYAITAPEVRARAR